MRIVILTLYLLGSICFVIGSALMLYHELNDQSFTLPIPPTKPVREPGKIYLRDAVGHPVAFDVQGYAGARED